jgi:hypothetical protein
MRSILLLMGALLVAGLLVAQDPRGAIVGRVVDATGAVIADIEVRATNKAKGVVAAGRTSSAGNFSIPFLLAGFYTVTIEAPGFKKFVRDNVEVRVSESVELAIAMELGAVTETIQVTAEAPVLNTTDASQGTVIEDRAIVELPLMGGNPVEFALLDPAVMNETDMRGRYASATNASSQWSAMGAGSFRNEFQIDGISNTYAEGNGRARVAFNPPAAAIGQFKIITNPFDASGETYWVNLVRLDHAFSASHRAFLRLHYDFWEEDKNRYYEKPIQGIVLNRINRGIALDDVILLTPNLVFNIRYGITQQDFTEYRITRGIDLGALGFSSNLTRLIDPKRATLPRVSVGSYSRFSVWEKGDGANNSLTHSFNGAFSTQRGKHALRWGADFRNYRAFGNRYPFETAPDFTFSTSYTRGPLDSSGASPIGQDLAAMLMGVPNSGSMETVASFAIQTLYFGSFIQDDIKLTPNLTVNVGLRYELEWPMTERFDRVVTGFAFDTPSPIDAEARAAYARAPIPEIPAGQFRVMGGLRFAGETPTGRSMFFMEKNNFMPRVGLAWQLSRRLTLRSGYGIFYGTLGVNATDPLQYGFTQATPIIPTIDNGQTYRALASNPFPDGLLPASGRAQGLATYLGQGIAFDYAGNRQAYSQRWTLALQKLLPGQVLIENSYVGSRTTHLNLTRQINATPAQYLSKSLTRDQATIL